VPLSLTAQELTLQESKTYMRWYSDILARTNSRTITMVDVFNFLVNFRITQAIKEKISKIFSKIVYSINIGEFFALLRLISHTLSGEEPSRRLIKVKAPVPTPPSIFINSSNNIENDVSSSRNGDTPHENKPLDLDSFTQFLLTGERPGEVPKKKRSKKLKSVKFSDQIVTDIHDDFMASPLPSPSPSLDYSLPMDQLLDRMKQGSAPQQQQQQVDEDEQEVLKEMESQINHFQNLHNVDTASIGGVPSSIHFHDGNSSEHLLRPNMTGPAQMARMFSPSPEPELLKPNMTGPVQMAQLYNRRQDDDLSPAVGVTNPTDMARMFAPSAQDSTSAQIASSEVPRISLQSFTSQMTGNTLANTQQNGQIRDTSSPRPPSNSFSSGRPIPPPPVPPPPPPSRRRGPSISSPQPPPLPPKVTAGQTNEDNSNNYNNDYNSYNSNYGNIANPAPTVTFNNYNNGSNNDTSFYNNQEASDSTANILDDLKALQAEVDKIRDMTGGF
ncbi:multicopy suppressor of clathrin deficiency, partial [Scheffersomyces stipitis CBS 6054]